ncbi:MAG: peptidylprolyl isomerase [Pseudobdellovibrionaceae bacterium]|nr:peptidylprolyl isomerase [Bdellovibrionales bacterium]USN46837.1 MAG: peptidylprolyl isomerase [Pseudobdellovibrionaceae bacterium]
MKFFVFFICINFLLVQLSYAKIVERIVAIVNQEIITLSDIEDFQSRLKKGGLVDQALLKSVDKNKILANKEALVEQLINERIVDSEIKRLELTVPIERVEQEIRSITRRNGISRDQLKTKLEQEGLKFSEYQDFVKSSLERRSLIEREVSSKIKISDEDVANFYVQNSTNKDTLTFKYTISHILFKPDSQGAERAEKVSKKIQSGATFESMASQFSEDPNFSQGGLLGTFALNELSSEFQQAIKLLAENDVTSVVKSPMGFHIIKVNKKVLAPDPHFESNKEQLRESLFAQEFDKQFANWLEQKRQESFIRINEP